MNVARALLLVVALAVGVVAPVVAQAEPAAAVGTIHTLVNGKCTVKVGFNARSGWIQVWSTGCAYVSLEVMDYSCWCWSAYRAEAVKYPALPYGTFRQTGNISENVNGVVTAACANKGAYFGYVYTRSTAGSVRDGTVGVWGSRSGW